MRIWHLLRFSVTPSLRTSNSTVQTCDNCLSALQENMIISWRYNRENSHFITDDITYSVRWNVSGALCSSNCIPENLIWDDAMWKLFCHDQRGRFGPLKPRIPHRVWRILVSRLAYRCTHKIAEWGSNFVDEGHLTCYSLGESVGIRPCLEQTFCNVPFSLSWFNNSHFSTV